MTDRWSFVPPPHGDQGDWVRRAGQLWVCTESGDPGVWAMAPRRGSGSATIVGTGSMIATPVIAHGGLPRSGSRNENRTRIGDAERNTCIGQLREHYAAGRLTYGELDERLDLALAAATQAQLGSLLGDLPRVHPGFPPPPPPEFRPDQELWMWPDIGKPPLRVVPAGQPRPRRKTSLAVPVLVLAAGWCSPLFPAPSRVWIISFMVVYFVSSVLSRRRPR